MNDFSPDDLRLRATEQQMRRALGLDGVAPASPKPAQSSAPSDGPGLHRRRFVRDGEVPVTIVHRTARPEEPAGANQLDAARQALREQTAARESAERSLAEAQAMVRDLQTKLAHERMTSESALQLAEARLAETRQAVADERTLREQAESARDAAVATLETERETTRQLVADAAAGKSRRAKAATAAEAKKETRRGRPPKVREIAAGQESDIVEWWVPGWQDKYR